MKNNIVNIQPTMLKDNFISIYPLDVADFDSLYNVASDPLIWEQHPAKDRYKKEIFIQFFNDAIASRGALKIIDNTTNKIIGSSRFYDYAEKDNIKSIIIGYSFIARDFWGKKINFSMKKLMIEYIFNYVDLIYFHAGVDNLRSRKAIEKLGAKKVSVENESVVYSLTELDWALIK